jgi:4-amino-4-deoxy-L-arabinose transferase-like glycosyltransferase/streptogramin lyase
MVVTFFRHEKTIKLLRSVLVGCGLVLVATTPFVSGLDHWFNLPSNFLYEWRPSYSLPYFSNLHYPFYFGPALIPGLVGLVLFQISGNPARLLPDLLKSPRLPEINLSDTTRGWQHAFKWLLRATTLLLAFTISQAIINRGDLHPLLWLLNLVSGGLTLYCNDRANQRSSVVARSEIRLICGYILYLLALAFVFRNPTTETLTLLAGAALTGWLWFKPNPVSRISLLIGVLVLGESAFLVLRPGATFGDEIIRLELVAVALALCGWLWRTRRLPAEIAGFLAATFSAFAAYTYQFTSWRYTFIGDEFSFFERAKGYLTDGNFPNPLDWRGVYDLNPVFASYIHVGSMTLFGMDVYGWRISETLMVFLAALPLYVFVRSLFGVRPAFMSLVVFLASHHLLALSKIGYNNLQALPAYLLSLALLVLAVRRNNLTGIFLCGIASALAFYTYGVTIPFIFTTGLLLGLLYLGAAWKRLKLEGKVEWRKLLVSLGLVMLIFGTGVALTALPRLTTNDWIRPLAEKTTYRSEVPNLTNPLTQQIIPNFLYTLTASLRFNDTSHYISGALLDPLGSFLMLLGLAALVSLVFRRIIALWLVVGFVAGCLFVGGLVSYPYPANTRTFILVPFYAIFAGLGLERLLVGKRPRLAQFLTVVLLTAVVVLNLYQFWVISERTVPKHSISMVVKLFQQEPDFSNRYLVTETDVPSYTDAGHADLVMEAYNIPEQHLLLLPSKNLRSILAELSENAALPFQLLVPADSSEYPFWLEAIRETWDKPAERWFKDGTDLTQLIVVTIEADTPRLNPAPEDAPPAFVVDPAFTPQSGDNWHVEKPRDVAVGADGSVYVINGVSKEIEVFDPAGVQLRSIPGGWTEPCALVINSKNDLIVLDAEGKYPLTRLHPDGTIIARSDPNQGFYYPRSLALGPNDEIYVADTGQSRVVRVSPYLAAQSVIKNERFDQIASLRFVGDQLVAVAASKLLVFNKNNEIVREWALPDYNTIQPPRILAGQNQTVVVTNPASGELMVYDLEGNLTQTVAPPSGLENGRPVGIAVSGDGEVYVAENEADRIQIYNWNSSS